MKQEMASPGLADLPEAALKRIIRDALGLSGDEALRPNPEAQRNAVALARTNRRMRRATATAIESLSFPDEEGLWPSVSVLSPTAWPGLRSLNCTVNRSTFLGFLKWLIPATDITHLRVHVTGEPYPQTRLGQLERMLLGRMFTQVGPDLVELDIAGIDCQALVFGSLFQCTKLRKLSLGAYGGGTPSTLLSMMILLCLVNREHLDIVEFPFSQWKTQMESVPDGVHLHAASKVTWETLFGSYKAGLKESAVNLPSKEEELVASFKKMSLRMEALETAMNAALAEFSALASSQTSGDVPNQVLFQLLPNLSIVNGETR